MGSTGNLLGVLSGQESIKTENSVVFDPKTTIVLGLVILAVAIVIVVVSKRLK